MFRFQHQEYFVFLVLVGLAVLFFLFYLLWRNKKIKLFGKEELVTDLMPSYSSVLSKIKFVLLASALFFGVFGLANLQRRGKVEKISRKGIDVMIALDVSNSMYAQDLQPSRLEKAKLFANKLIDKLNGNRMGLILFAGRSYLSVPLTNDIEALKMNLGLASPEIAPTQGTVLGDALQMAYESFNSKDAKHKAIVLISDGEDHDEKAINEARSIGKKGIMLCTVGVGSEQGAPIPLPEGGTKVDRAGHEVLSKMNDEELNKIARSGQGIFVNLSDIGSSIRDISNRLNQISKTNLGESSLASYSSYFQYFLGLMFLLLLVEFFLPSRKPNRRLRTAFHTILFILIPQFLSAQTEDKNIYMGNEFYKKDQFVKAAESYQKTIQDKKARTKDPARFNLGNAMLLGKKPEEALKQFEYVGAKAKDKKLSAFAYHNAGNVMAEQDKWQEAINYYKAALKKNPKASDTKYNLAYAQKKLKQQQNKNQDKNKKDDQDKEKKPQKPNDQEEKKDDEGKKDKQDEKDGDKEKSPPKDQGNKPKSAPSKLTKQQAKKLLDALNRAEKKVKDKKQKEKAGVISLDKDW